LPAPEVPPRPARLRFPLPVVVIVAALSETPTNGPPSVGTACWLADSVMWPSAVRMLEPEARAMVFIAVMLTSPVPPAAMSLVVLGRLTIPTSATVSPWPAANVSGPLKFTVSVTSSPPIASEA